MGIFYDEQLMTNSTTTCQQIVLLDSSHRGLNAIKERVESSVSTVKI